MVGPKQSGDASRTHARFSYFFDSADANDNCPLSPRSCSAIASILGATLVLVGSVIDNTVWMSGGAKGLAQHWGFWVIFTTTPLIIILTGHILDNFKEIVGGPENYIDMKSDPASASRIRQLILAETESVLLRGRSRFLLYFGILVGLFYAIINDIKTYNPGLTYGHDVFDSAAHSWGYATTKLYLLPIFIVVYPFSIFIAAHVTWSVTRVLRLACENKVLRVRLFHHDNCGGTSRFGYLNLLVMTLCILFFAILIGMIITHKRTYFVTESALIFCSLFLIALSVIGVYSVHRFVVDKKRDCLRSVGKKIDDQLRGALDGDLEFHGDFLILREHLIGLRTYPYTSKAMLAVVVLRYTPAIVALVSMIKS